MFYVLLLINVKYHKQSNIYEHFLKLGIKETTSSISNF